MKFQKKILVFLLLFGLVLGLATPYLTFAQGTNTPPPPSGGGAGVVSGGVSAFGQKVYGSAEPMAPQKVIALLIRTLLGFLGMLFIVLIIYGGFIWMTAGGEEQKVTKAKGIITSAVVGLIIVMVSYAIANFVINTLVSRTGTDTGYGGQQPTAPDTNQGS